MGIWIMQGTTDGGDCNSCALLDSVSMTPLPVRVFDSWDDADEFTRWATSRAGHRLATLRRETLDELRQAWAQERTTDNGPESREPEADRVRVLLTEAGEIALDTRGADR